MIELDKVTYAYKTYKKSSGLMGSVRDFFSRSYEEALALDGISLSIKQGEFVGLLGANGAGKTTLIKLLTGILQPTSGRITSAGTNPYLRERNYLKNIGVVLGQKSQLIWDLPASETLSMLQVVYDIEPSLYKARLQQLTQLLSIEEKLDIPVRKLSLGERVKFELICALIHSPRILFLDEPTIGLDVQSQQAIRTFLVELNRKEQVTILLTSHYMKDIESMCDRVIVLSQSRVRDDLTIPELLDKYRTEEKIQIQFKGEVPARLAAYEVGKRSVQLTRPQYEELASEIDLAAIDSLSSHSEEFEDIILRLLQKG